VQLARQLLTDPRGWIATGMGSGFAPRAPGTFGTLAALPLCVLAGHYLPLWGYAALTLCLFIVGVWAAGWVIHTLKIQDPGVVVIDEWVGMLLTWLPVAYWQHWAARAPAVSTTTALLWLGAAFLAFRLTDILKPWPASWADQRLHGGFGAMLDDVFAGLWSALIVGLMLWQAPSLFG
jgi:phosphatidylglycerophosphatase A